MSSQQFKTELTAPFKANKYTYSGSPSIGLDKTRRLVKYSLSLEKAWSQHSSQLKQTAFHKPLKKGKLWSTNREMNLHKAMMQPTSFCTSWVFLGAFIFRITYTLFRLALIAHSITMYPKNFPLWAPKVHLHRYNFSSYPRIVANVFSKSRSMTWADFTRISPHTPPHCAHPANWKLCTVVVGRSHPFL